MIASGFSLAEVLIALFLLSILSLKWLDHQNKGKLIFYDVFLRQTIALRSTNQHETTYPYLMPCKSDVACGYPLTFLVPRHKPDGPA